MIQPISEFHPDIIKAVAALPAASSANAGQRRYRTTDNFEYYSDGTRWLSTQLYERPYVPTNFANPALPPGAGGYRIMSLPLFSSPDIWIDSFVLIGSNYSAHSAVDYYTIGCDGFSGSWTTQSWTSIATWRVQPVVTGQVIPGASTLKLQLFAQQTGAPGTVEWGGVLRYRLVG